MSDLPLATRLNRIGVTSVDVAVFPDYDSEAGYIRFMSDGGVSDKAQCDEFVKWLKEEKFQYVRMDEVSVGCLFGQSTTILDELFDFEG